jgi:hypothetical protein
VDERLMKKCIGKPVPEWDMAHRLPIDRSVGPDVRETGTVFRTNSIFMDVTEPSFLEKQWFITASVLAFIFIGIGPYVYWLTEIRYPRAGGLFGNVFELCVSFFFGFFAWKLGRGLFFGLRRRPIRFHRSERKLYALRSRRHFAKPGQGDVIWEAPWTKESIFCLHRENSTFGVLFHIRHYTVDERGIVTRVFSIGREWMPADEVELALAQWNYWCRYMNEGPNGLPKPMLFHTENETPRESFLFALYGVGLQAPVIWRIIMMPFILVFTVMRIVANATCRDPVWPEAIDLISRVAPDDLYAEPRTGTPVGWAETVLAKRRGTYPKDPKSKVESWQGEPDGEANARLWLTDTPPRHLTGG